MTSFEKKVLKDKHVTLAELLESTQVYIECLTQAGIGYQRASGGDFGPSSIQTLIEVQPSVPDPDQYAAKLQAKAHACLAGVSAVEDVWVLQNQASQSDIDKAKAKYVACLRGSGLAVPTGSDFSSASKAAREFLQEESTAEVDASSPTGRELSAVTACSVSISQSSEVALPGLQRALAELNTARW